LPRAVSCAVTAAVSGLVESDLPASGFAVLAVCPKASGAASRTVARVRRERRDAGAVLDESGEVVT
jgi:hypothetical protein